MITINFFKDGAYIKGHDRLDICSVISYAMWNCINSCLDEDSDVCFYESNNDKDEYWHTLGFTFIKINTNVEQHVKLLNRFKKSIISWCEELYHDRVSILIRDENTDWKLALADAKKEQEIMQ